ncbi:hypothetical protein HLI01_22105 [Rhizobium laguerreae]|uniref:hypothetical protein n=1 Tax=Rhizobium laguerreae TaxID=1076926 RepID=UPI001478C001|nr:hypothetical protein [Rhizobium laguerreae]NNH59431.1 hypothetical protein [Rhizobium laguerreae]
MPDEMTMVERCAKAIYEKRNGAGCTPWSRQKQVHRAPYLDDARAAIEEMRNPSGEMEDWFRDNLEHTETGAWIWKGRSTPPSRNKEKA